MEFTNEIIDQIDGNNMKAREILRLLMCMVGNEGLTVNGVDVSVVIVAAFDYLQKNDEIFNNFVGATVSNIKSPYIIKD